MSHSSRSRPRDRTMTSSSTSAPTAPSADKSSSSASAAVAPTIHNSNKSSSASARRPSRSHSRSGSPRRRRHSSRSRSGSHSRSRSGSRSPSRGKKSDNVKDRKRSSRSPRRSRSGSRKRSHSRSRSAPKKEDVERKVADEQKAIELGATTAPNGKPTTDVKPEVKRRDTRSSRSRSEGKDRRQSEKRRPSSSRTPPRSRERGSRSRSRSRSRSGSRSPSPRHRRHGSRSRSPPRHHYCRHSSRSRSRRSPSPRHRRRPSPPRFSDRFDPRNNSRERHSQRRGSPRRSRSPSRSPHRRHSRSRSPRAGDKRRRRSPSHSRSRSGSRSRSRSYSRSRSPSRTRRRYSRERNGPPDHRVGNAASGEEAYLRRLAMSGGGMRPPDHYNPHQSFHRSDRPPPPSFNEPLPPVGVIFKGRVERIQPFGAFLSLPGMRRQGLVHISRVAASRVDRIEDVLRSGQEVWVKVVGINDDKISLSMKDCDQTTGADLGLPAESFVGGGGGGGGRHAPRAPLPDLYSIHTGRVVTIQPFGAFVELLGSAPSGMRLTQGLIHITQLSGSRRVENVSDVVSVGDEVKVKVVRIEGDKVSLSLKAVDQTTGEDLDPSNTAAAGRSERGGGASNEPPELYSIHRGKVTKIADFGAFVSLPGYRKNGLVHIGQIASYKVDSVEKAVSVGEEVWVKVVKIEDDGNKIGLSMRTIDQRTGVDSDASHASATADDARAQRTTAFNESRNPKNNSGHAFDDPMNGMKDLPPSEAAAAAASSAATSAAAANPDSIARIQQALAILKQAKEEKKRKKAEKKAKKEAKKSKKKDSKKSKSKKDKKKKKSKESSSSGSDSDASSRSPSPRRK